MGWKEISVMNFSLWVLKFSKHKISGHMVPEKIIWEYINLTSNFKTVRDKGDSKRSTAVFGAVLKSLSAGIICNNALYVIKLMIYSLMQNPHRKYTTVRQM